jgi:glycosyltransferase involved in cell wall biosynthesis
LNFKPDSSKDNNQNIIFTYWRWTQGKNLELIFKTYENLKNQITDLVLIIWWDWECLQDFKLKYKNNKNIKFLWNLVKEQIINNLILSKVFLFPSTIDSFWLVKLESLSIWVPVVCLDNSNEEIIKNWINGFCVKTENEFIQKTNEILTNDLLQKQLSKNSSTTIRDFNKSNFEKQLNDIFRV